MYALIQIKEHGYDSAKYDTIIGVFDDKDVANEHCSVLQYNHDWSFFKVIPFDLNNIHYELGKYLQPPQFWYELNQ
jgi:hypothetical protein